MVFILLRGIYAIWFLGALALGIVALADLLFGSAPFGQRLRNLVPRIAVALVWPLALMTPRGRFLLWGRWKQ